MRDELDGWINQLIRGSSSVRNGHGNGNKKDINLVISLSIIYSLLTAPSPPPLHSLGSNEKEKRKEEVSNQDV